MISAHFDVAVLNVDLLVLFGGLRLGLIFELLFDGKSLSVWPLSDHPSKPPSQGPARVRPPHERAEPRPFIINHPFKGKSYCLLELQLLKHVWSLAGRGHRLRTEDAEVLASTYGTIDHVQLVEHLRLSMAFCLRVKSFIFVLCCHAWKTSSHTSGVR